MARRKKPTRRRIRRRRNPKWTPQEKNLLKRLYTSASDEEILAAFPGRRLDSIKQYTSKSLRVKRRWKTAGSVNRILTTNQAAQLIGVSPSTFKRAYAKHIPHDIAHHGGFLFDPADVKAWYSDQIDARKIRDRSRKLVLAPEASKILRHILSQLPIDGPELAKHLKIKFATFRNYLEGRNKGVPITLITEAESFLYNYLHGSKIITSFLPASQVGEELRAIKEQLGLGKREMATKLKIPEGTFSRYLYPKIHRDKYIPSKVLVKARKLLEAGASKNLPAKSQIVAALESTGGVQITAARRLGISESTINFLIQRYGLEAKPRLPSERITKKELVQLLKRFKGNKTSVARHLDISNTTLYKLLRMVNLF